MKLGKAIEIILFVWCIILSLVLSPYGVTFLVMFFVPFHFFKNFNYSDIIFLIFLVILTPFIIVYGPVDTARHLFFPLCLGIVLRKIMDEEVAEAK